MVTVVDAANLPARLRQPRLPARPRRARDRRTTSAPSSSSWSTRSSSPTSIVLNKVARRAGADRRGAPHHRRSLNPGARLIETDFGDVPPRQRLRHRPLRLRRGAHAAALGQGAARLRRPRAGDRGIRHLLASSTGRAGRSTPTAIRAVLTGAAAGRPSRQGPVLGGVAAGLDPRVQPRRGARPTSGRSAAGGRRCRRPTGRPSRGARPGSVGNWRAPSATGGRNSSSSATASTATAIAPRSTGASFAHGRARRRRPQRIRPAKLANG